MENTKYKLDTEDTIVVQGHKLYRIIALRDIGDTVKAGDKGGYIEDEDNLSHFDNCWVGDEAQVFDGALVFKNAIVEDFAKVYDKARVGGEAQVFGHAEVFDDVRVFDAAFVYGNAKVSGGCLLCGDTQIRSNTAITDEEHEQATHDLHEAMGRSSDIQPPLSELTTEDLLNELKSRGGHPAALAEAALLCMRKSEDYNGGGIDNSEYFPFGAISYAQMLHVKATRFNALVRKELAGETVNFEGLRDTALDIINYAGFYIDSVTYD